jgi:HSP20 family protein
MANESKSREHPSRQQSAERSQTGAAQQGTGAQQGTAQSGYGQGARGQGGSAPSGVSTWQGGRQQGGAMQSRRGSQSMAPYSADASGYGSGPFSIMRRLSDEMDRLFENFGFGRAFSPLQQGGWNVGEYGENLPSMWSPHIEVCEREGKLHIEADLPGMRRDDIQVRVEQDQLILQGERRHEQKQERSGYYRSERSYGSFYRAIPLPEGTNADSATATFRDGVLEIDVDIPHQQERGRTLEIREGSSASSSGGYSGTGSGATYGSGTTSSMQGASSGTSGTTGSAPGAASGGSGTMYSGSGNPSVGGAGMGSGTSSTASGTSSAASGTSGSRGTKGSTT